MPESDELPLPFNPADWSNPVSPGAVLTALGQLFPSQIADLEIPNMNAGVMIEVPTPANPRFVGRSGILVDFIGAPRPQLGICGAWVNGTGQVFVRFIAGSGGVQAGTQRVGIVAFAR
jgi:hypothetical protein